MSERPWFGFDYATVSDRTELLALDPERQTFVTPIGESVLSFEAEREGVFQASLFTEVFDGLASLARTIALPEPTGVFEAAREGGELVTPFHAVDHAWPWVRQLRIRVPDRCPFYTSKPTRMDQHIDHGVSLGDKALVWNNKTTELDTQPIPILWRGGDDFEVLSLHLPQDLPAEGLLGLKIAQGPTPDSVWMAVEMAGESDLERSVYLGQLSDSELTLTSTLPVSPVAFGALASDGSTIWASADGVYVYSRGAPAWVPVPTARFRLEVARAAGFVFDHAYFLTGEGLIHRIDSEGRRQDELLATPASVLVGITSSWDHLVGVDQHGRIQERSDDGQWTTIATLQRGLLPDPAGCVDQPSFCESDVIRGVEGGFLFSTDRTVLQSADSTCPPIPLDALGRRVDFVELGSEILAMPSLRLIRRDFGP